MEPKFVFELNQPVRITVSSELGVVIARAEYAHSDNCYLLRYRSVQGAATESWWTESALTAA